MNLILTINKSVCRNLVKWNITFFSFLSFKKDVSSFHYHMKKKSVIWSKIA